MTPENKPLDSLQSPSVSRSAAPQFSHPGETTATRPLGTLSRGESGSILTVCDPVQAPGSGSLERRLLELGFIEGAYVELLHTGFLGGDPLAVRINQTQTVALRRREANAVLVNVIINEHR